MKHTFESPYYPIEQGLPAAHTAMIVFSVAASWQFPGLKLECEHFIGKAMHPIIFKHVKCIRTNHTLRNSTINTHERKMTDAELENELEGEVHERSNY